MPGSGGHDPAGRSARLPCVRCLAGTWALAERVPREPVFGIDRQLLEPDGPAGLALLTRCIWSGEEGFDPSAALVDHARDTGYRLAPATWRYILEQLRPDEAFEVGQAALKQGNAEVARAAWTTVVQASDAEVHTRRVRLPASSYDQLAEHDPEVAQTLRERQTSWPLRSLYYPDHRSQAAYNLAVLRAQAGELDAAETLYRWVVDRGHLDLGPAAMIALGRLSAQRRPRPGRLVRPGGRQRRQRDRPLRRPVSGLLVSRAGRSCAHPRRLPAGDRP